MAAEGAASILRDFFTRHTVGSVKQVPGGTEGLVTEADLAAERSILSTIQKAFPDDAILAEESGAHNSNQLWMWIIDPLDGTNNFACGVPQFSISIACSRNGSVEIGIVVDPMRDEWYVAVRGCGAWLNGKPAKVNSHSTLDQTLIGTGFYYDRGELMRRTLKTIEDFFGENVLGIRRFGSAALDLCYVGCGRFGGYFEFRLSPWDFAAAMLFVHEAGGRVTDCVEQSLIMARTSVMASNGYLHDVMGRIVRKNYPAEYRAG